MQYKNRFSWEVMQNLWQKQTHDKILKLEHQINRVESILLVSVGALITGMAYVIFYITHKINYATFKTLYFKRND